ncbi:MAG TPA: tetratricopeptide repeat protein [Gemmataceae bacterium]|nr:tetratricopeptide repeat protein [Gemmataceae bacterium]
MYRVTKARVILVVVLLALLAVSAYALGSALWRRHHYRAAEEALDRRDFAAARAHLDSYLELAPHDRAVRLMAARAARRAHDFEAASHQLGELGREDAPPDGVELEVRLMHAQQGDLAEARRLLSVCEDHPDDPETPDRLEAAIEGSLPSLAEGYAVSLTYGRAAGEGYATEVRRGADLWLRLRPGRADQVEGLVWRAQVEVYTNDVVSARADVRKALELDPDHFAARLQLAFLLEQDAPAEAAAHLEKLLERQPDNRRVRFELAEVRRGLGQLDRARDLLDTLLAVDPRHVGALLARGRIALEAEPPRSEEAEGWFRRAFAEAPDDPDVSLALNDCLRMMPGRAAEAADFRERFQRLQAERAKRARNPLPPGH